ncbi:MAG: DUF2634 domain-containing protein [Peptococcaceae bacterium]
MSIFPMIQPEAIRTNVGLPLSKETDWDFARNIPIYRNGSPVIVTGKRAVLVWAWKALHTGRYRYDIYTWDYGNEIESLIGQPYTDELKKAEAVRYVRECLLINPYITDVTDVSITFLDGLISIQCKIITVYGEVNIDV